MTRAHPTPAELWCDQDKDGPEILGTYLPMAVGRRPNTDVLGLDKAGMRTDGKGYIIVDDQLRTNVPGGAIRIYYEP